ncbi:MAG: acylneuraminate cytidylyltransferase family protein [Candidatus Amulumruptor caecigallinarius]|nr:acylneuraminate cytidylyltransferase family protein [Candidatus Amulumruptor caecigallinarius]MCM1397372.1 acylneuraminate cytidylyltransferase family protein [Candidatus Amulumruptor caecigallinarius]MCM1454740.1 acylneuraminate cytidylyltransferase family protein [bacterium]
MDDKTPTHLNDNISAKELTPLVVIPARGGSKGIPGKNLREFAGRSLVARAIEAARAVAPDSHIILSTDSPEIAEAGRREGLPVDYMRPVHLATDTAGTQGVLVDAMDWADSRGLEFDCVVLLQPTSPLRTADDIRACMALYDPSRAEMSVTVKPSAANPYYDCFEQTPDGLLHVSKGDGTLTRRQDAPPAWQLNGAVYVISPEALRTMPMGRMRRIPCPMPAERSVDLDTLLDWEIAELVHARLNKDTTQP